MSRKKTITRRSAHSWRVGKRNSILWTRRQKTIQISIRIMRSTLWTLWTVLDAICRVLQSSSWAAITKWNESQFNLRLLGNPTWASQRWLIISCRSLESSLTTSLALRETQCMCSGSMLAGGLHLLTLLGWKRVERPMTLWILWCKRRLIALSSFRMLWLFWLTQRKLSQLQRWL